MTDSSERTSGGRAYRGGAAVAIVTALLTIWTTIVRDDGNGVGFFMVILAAGVGGFAARFRAAGMARATCGVAVMQVLLGWLVATAPSTASAPDGPIRILVASGTGAALWLISATLFRIAARGDREATAML